MAAAAAPGGSPPVASASGAGGPAAGKAAGGARPRAQLHTSGLREAPTWARARLLTSRRRWGWGALRACSTPDGPPLLHGHWLVECGLRPFGSATSRIFPGSVPFANLWFGLALGEHHHRGRARSPQAPFQNVVTKLVMWALLSGLGASCLSGCRSLRCFDSCPVCLLHSMGGEEVIRTAVFNWVWEFHYRVHRSVGQGNNLAYNLAFCFEAFLRGLFEYSDIILIPFHPFLSIPHPQLVSC